MSTAGIWRTLARFANVIGVIVAVAALDRVSTATPGTRPKWMSRPLVAAPSGSLALSVLGGVGGSKGRRGARDPCPQGAQYSPRLARHCDHGCSHFSALLHTPHMRAPGFTVPETAPSRLLSLRSG
jgi:hypothetical protein